MQRTTTRDVRLRCAPCSWLRAVQWYKQLLAAHPRIPLALALSRWHNLRGKHFFEDSMRVPDPNPRSEFVYSDLVAAINDSAMFTVYRKERVDASVV